MSIESSITPYPALNQLSLQYSIFGFLLRNITKPGNHFAARCYLSALDDTNSLPPGQIFNLLTVLDFYYETERFQTERGALATIEGRGRDGRKRLYVPVTRKVSLTVETFGRF
ncbi:hypothetical protein SAMN05216339_1012 [Nitrosomonas eutropha]|uniref:Uncharacterized protein n=1 Tax=Nitrosomonas eutropha TaxID=916 RepID=A0A1I7ETL0_9PROT|nr:hypothetical protein [Nitrosomonas eutropha]SFU27243.1 hypothetical protein SAMN05216339_1012 [Nitrosomonas eutropha]